MTDFRELRLGDTFEYRTESTDGLVVITTYRVVQISARNDITTKAVARVAARAIYNNGVQIDIED